MIGGVSTGIGNYLGIDPVIIRLLFVLFSFFALAGVITYLILWIVLPDARDEQGRPPPPPAPRFRPLERFNAQPAWAQATMIVAFVLLVIGMFNWPGGRFVWPLALLIIGLLLLSDRGIGQASPPPDPPGPSARPPQAPPSEPPEPPNPHPEPRTAEHADDGPSPSALPPPPPAHMPDPADDDTMTIAQPPPPAAPGRHDLAPPASPAPPPKPASVLGQLTLAVALVAVGVGVALQNLGIVRLGARDYLAVAVVIIGLGLLVGAFAGRARWLALIGILLLPPLAVATVFSTVTEQGYAGEWDVGDRYLTPTAVAELEPGYHLLAGNLHLDLRQLDFDETDEPVVVSTQTRFGQTTILVGDDVDVELSGRVTGGELRGFGRTRGGMNVSMEHNDDVDDEVGTVVIELHHGFGEARVERR